MEVSEFRPDQGEASFWAKYRIPLVLGGGSLLLIVLSLVLLIKSVQTEAPIEFHEATSSAASGSPIRVDVEGAVVAAGVYSLSAEARVEEALQAAGGLRPDADMAVVARTLNRAAKLTDGGKIYVPKVGETPAVAGVGAGSVSINTASVGALEALPGIGPATAAKIVANRPYQNLTELVGKKVLSPTLFNKLKEQLTL